MVLMVFVDNNLRYSIIIMMAYGNSLILPFLLYVRDFNSFVAAFYFLLPLYIEPF